jgi:hypothetical protein
MHEGEKMNGQFSLMIQARIWKTGSEKQLVNKLNTRQIIVREWDHHYIYKE